MTYDIHIVVLAFPFGTHALPLLALVRRLAATAPSVKFSFFSTQNSNQSTFKGLELDNVKPYNVSDGAPKNYVFRGDMDEVVDYFMTAMKNNLKKYVKEAEAEVGIRAGCLLTDAFLWFSGEVAAGMGVAWVPIWLSAAFSLCAHMHTDLIRTIVESHGKGESSEPSFDLIPGMQAVRKNDFPDIVVNNDPNSKFEVIVYKMVLSLPKATVVVLNSFYELEQTIINGLKSKLQKVLTIGPLTTSLPLPLPKLDESGSLSWLDKQKHSSVAYISFGSLGTLPTEELLALAQGLEASKVPFLWSLKDDAKALLPKGFLEKTVDQGLGKIVSWAPQQHVLAHGSVGVFFTHCGWNSVLETITLSCGVPMVCRPLFGDHCINARFIEEWKIGMKIEGGAFTKNRVVKALDLMLSKENGNKMRENIMVLQGQAAKAIGLNGSSTENLKTLKDIITCSKAP